MRTSRRGFMLGSAAGLIAARRARAAPAALTAQQIVDRVRAALGPLPPGNTVDGLKAGDPSTVVTAIWVTTMATLDVVRRAPEGRLIVTYEPVFYSANDDPGTRAADSVYLAKKKAIDDRRLVVYRLFDQWNANQPDAFARTLGTAIRGTAVEGSARLYDVPETTLGALATLNQLAAVRVVGNRATRVRRVFLNPGTTTLAATMAALRTADVVIAGEPREWEAVPYVLDCNTAGQQKGLIVFGRIVSQPAGVLVNWVKNLVPELSVTYAGGANPYWTP